MTKDTKDIRAMLDDFSTKLRSTATEYAEMVTPKVRTSLNESNEYDGVGDDDNKDGVPYTMQDELMQSITQTAKTQFGADFTKVENPMIYYPENGDVELNGVVATLNDAKFQFRYKDTNGGCYIWVSPLNLNDNSLRTISVIHGVYKNWKQDLSNAEDIKPMSIRNEDTNNMQQNQQQQTPGMVPGDDAPSNV